MSSSNSPLWWLRKDQRPNIKGVTTMNESVEEPRYRKHRTMNKFAATLAIVCCLTMVFAGCAPSPPDKKAGYRYLNELAAHFDKRFDAIEKKIDVCNSHEPTQVLPCPVEELPAPTQHKCAHCDGTGTSRISIGRSYPIPCEYCLGSGVAK